MRLVVLQENLKRGLAIVAPAIAGKTSLPVLNNVLFEVVDGHVWLAGNDLTLGIRTKIGGKVEEGGSVTLPAKLLSDLVGNLPKDTVELALEDPTLTMTVSCKGTKAKIKGIDADEYPKMASSDHAPLASISADDLATIAATVAVAAAAENTNPNPVLQGVLFDLGSTNTFAAIDGYRLAVKTTEGQTYDPQVIVSYQVIVPAPSLAKIAKVFAGSDEPITIRPVMAPVYTRDQIGEKTEKLVIDHLIFETSTTTAVTRVIDGKYPEWQRFMPVEAANTMILNRAALAAAIRRLSLFSQAAGNILKFTLNADGLVIEASAAEIGESSETITVKEGDFSGMAGAQIALNTRYAGEAISSINTEFVTLECNTPNTPAVFKPVGDGGNYFHLVMPMRIP